MKPDRKKQRRELRKKKEKEKRRRRVEKLMEAASNPSRNVHVERGRMVVVSDITPYARQKCTKCKGKGIVGARTAGGVQGMEPCVCAAKRFIKAHPEIILDQNGQSFWPAEEETPAPPETAPPADG